tara:strand:- start:582 stop:1217 length:636 start_codon:yes stop_codon:yes gene_type:complete
MDIADIRREFVYSGLSRSDLLDDPISQFEKWFIEAKDSNLENVNALSLATSGNDGMPACRTVLLKGFDKNGFVFYTNYGSRKAKDIEENPKAALLFHWLELDRQVKVQGSIKKIDRSETIKYFSSRPRGSQLGAWSSSQSSPISSRNALTEEFKKIEKNFKDKDIPTPDFWGGYRVVPLYIEFWQGRENRLHDRFEYRKEGSDWLIQRLSP